MENRARLVALWRVPAPDIGHRWNGFRGNTEAVAFMVSYDVVDDGAKDGVERKEPTRNLWLRKLSNCMGMVAETA